MYTSLQVEYNAEDNKVANLQKHFFMNYKDITDDSFIKKIIDAAAETYNLTTMLTHKNVNVNVIGKNEKQILNYNTITKAHDLDIHRDSDICDGNVFTIVYYYDISENIQNDQLIFYEAQKCKEHGFIGFFKKMYYFCFGKMKPIITHQVKSGDIITFKNESYHRDTEYFTNKDNSKRYVLTLFITTE